MRFAAFIQGSARARRRGGLAAATMLALVMVVVPPVAAPALAASDPVQISFTLEGCRDPSVPLEPNFICADGDYTTGNLGKTWAELDLVPHRVTVRNGNGTQTYTFVVAGDYRNAANTATGWDFISPLVLNAAKSDASCGSATMGPLTITPPGAGVGGAFQTIYRTVTLTQQAGATCVYDYVQRLALGASGFSGSSLQSNLWNQNLGSQGIGQKRIQLPVNEIAPQELSKTMTASRGSANVWAVTKSANPARVVFDDTCTPPAPQTKTVQVTIQWTKTNVPSDQTTLTATITITNPASRTVLVDLQDQFFEGTDQSTSVGALFQELGIEVGPNSTVSRTHQVTVTSTATQFNDVATATYRDKQFPDQQIPGTTQATASATVQDSGEVTNATATLSDTESIVGAGLTFAVAAPSTGSFSGYTAGTFTTGPVVWNSGAVSDSGSVTFTKTIRVAQAQISTGTLSDTVTLTGSDGFTTGATLDVDIDVDAQVSLTLDKTIPDVLTGAETAEFDFEVRKGSAAGQVVGTHTFTFGAGDTSKSHTFTGLEPGTYVVVETDSDGFAPQPNQTVTITLPTCSETVTFQNGFAPATARAAKVTNPGGSEDGWDLRLQGPGGVDETITTTGPGFHPFTSILDAEGTYTITETQQAGWDLTNVAGDGAGATSCSFTVDYPDDADQVFSCTFTNTQRGAIIIEKQTIPDGADGSFTFTGDAAGTISDDGQITVSNLVPGTYTSTEADPTPDFDLTSIVCDDGASATVSTGDVGSRTATFRLDPGETVTCTFTNTQRGMVRVIKTSSGQVPPAGAFTFQIRQGASTTSEGTVLATDTNDAAGVVDFDGLKLAPGDYQLCETAMLPGWANTLDGFTPLGATPEGGDNSTECVDFTLDPGETEVFTIDNIPPPGGDARTIGFWKNWSGDCTGGNQTDVLGDTLASFPGGGVLIGDLFVDDPCGEAVPLLNKSDISNGRKKANDAAYGLAAQLLAARLNIQATAGSCAAADQAMADAQALLDAINFTGTGDYLGPKVKGAKATQRAQAEILAATLDAYNNNLLC